MVEQGNKGTPVIKTDDGQTFNILGQNMTSMIGKTVKVTGTLSKGKATRSIIVTISRKFRTNLHRGLTR